MLVGRSVLVGLYSSDRNREAISPELYAPPPLQELHDEHHERDNQEDMDQVTCDAEPESQGPHHEQNQ